MMRTCRSKSKIILSNTASIIYKSGALTKEKRVKSVNLEIPLSKTVIAKKMLAKQTIPKVRAKIKIKIKIKNETLTNAFSEYPSLVTNAIEK